MLSVSREKVVMVMQLVSMLNLYMQTDGLITKLSILFFYFILTKKQKHQTKQKEINFGKINTGSNPWFPWIK